MAPGRVTSGGTYPAGTTTTSPTSDAVAFCDRLAQRQVHTLPGEAFERPAPFRLSLTATLAMVERAAGSSRGVREGLNRVGLRVRPSSTGEDHRAGNRANAPIAYEADGVAAHPRGALRPELLDLPAEPGADHDGPPILGSPRSCAVLLGAEADHSAMTATGDSHAALISPAARVVMAAATARVRSPRVADWGR